MHAPPEPAIEPVDAPRRPADGRVLWGAIVLFSALSLTCAALSDGFLTADALTHYLYSKYSFQHPALLVDMWGRPLVTGLFAIPAALGGRLAVRVTALLVALVCAFAAFRIARGQHVRRPVLAFVFTLAQPLVFLNSFAEMTELPFAALAGLAFLAYQARRWWAAAVLAALLPLARPEGFEFVALAVLGLLVHRKLLPLLVLPLPLLLWNHAGWEIDGRAGPWWRWLVDHWPYARESTYPSGSLLQFAFFLPAVVSPFVLPATLLGAWRSALPRAGAGEDQHLRACRVMTVAIPASILAVHTLLYWLGKMASYGEPRYLLVAAPFWAVLSARGWEWAFDAARWRDSIRPAAVAAVLPLAALLLHPVLPLRRPAHWEAAEKVAEQYRQTLAPAGYPKILAAHPAVFYYLGVSPVDPARVAPWHRDTVANPPAGVVLVWDPIYAQRNARTDRVVSLQDVRDAGWIPRPDLDAALLTSGTRSKRPTPDPLDQLAARGEWTVFVSPTRRE